MKESKLKCKKGPKADLSELVFIDPTKQLKRFLYSLLERGEISKKQYKFTIKCIKMGLDVYFEGATENNKITTLVKIRGSLRSTVG